MPFVVVGLFLIFAISFLILAIVIGAIAVVVTLVDNYLDNKRWKEQQAKEKAETEKRLAALPELKKKTPKPTTEELKAILLDWSFPDYSMPCLSTSDPLEFETLSDIKTVQTGESQIADNIYELAVTGEFHTNKPQPNYNFGGDMIFQYVFSDGSDNKETGWTLRKIIIKKCQEISPK